MTEPTKPSRRASLPDPTIEVEPESDETSLEVPEADAAEQARDATASGGQALRAREVPFDADPADLADQAREVEQDDEEYR